LRWRQATLRFAESRHAGWKPALLDGRLAAAAVASPGIAHHLCAMVAPSANPIVPNTAEDGLPTPQRYWSMLTLMVGLAMSVLDTAIVNVALPAIARDLHADPAELSLKDGEVYRFRWALTSDDKKWSVKCDWNGSCEESLKDKKIASYAFDCHIDPEKGRLHVKMVRTGTPDSPDSHTDIDELVVDSDGKVLRSFTIQQDAEKFAPGKGPARFFDKVSDAVDDPPAPPKS
jgi:hypothetical protein